MSGTTLTLILPQFGYGEDIKITYVSATQCFVFQEGENEITLTLEELDLFADFMGQVYK